MKEENKNTMPENADKPSEEPAMQPLDDQELEDVSGGGFWETVQTVLDYVAEAKNPFA